MDQRFDELPSTLPAYLGVLTRRRRYTGAAIPSITARAERARFDGDRLRAYRRLVDARAGEYLPPFAPQLLAAPLHLRLLADPAFPFPALGLVHLENRIETHAPVPAKEALTLDTRVAGIADHPKGHAITLETLAHRAGEAPEGADPLWRAETIALSRSAAPSESRSGPRREPPTPWTEERLRDPREEDVPEATGRAYARAAGDLNPIHQHALLARPFGLPRAIVHGTYTAAKAMAAYWPEIAAGETPDGAPLALGVRFRAPVFLPSRIRMGLDGEAIVVADARSGREQLRVTRAPRRED